MIVVDASVAVKWLFDEEDSGRARALFDGAPPLQASDLLLSDVGGSIVRRVNERILAAEDGSEIAAAWARLWASPLLTSHRLNGSMTVSAIDLATRIGHSLADCIYLALAIDLDCALITADRKFAQRAAVIHGGIEVIGDA